MESDEPAPPPVPEKRKRGRPKGSKGNFKNRSWQTGDLTGPLKPEDELQPWEEALAKWLATQTQRVEWPEMLQNAALIKGTSVTKNAVTLAKRKMGFKRAYALGRSEFNDIYITKAKNEAIRAIPKAVRVQSRALDALHRQFDKADADQNMDPLPIVRVVPTLANPFLAHVLPQKKEQSQTATIIHLSLTPEQMRGLEAPVMVVEAEEVKQVPAQIPA